MKRIAILIFSWALAACGGSDSITNVGTVNVSGLETGASWKYSMDAGTTWVAGSGGSFVLSGDGAKSVQVRQTDASGNVSVSSNVLSFALDTSIAVPTVALTADTGSSAIDKITSNGAIVLGGVEASATVEYSSNGSSGWSATAPTFTQGSNTVYVRQIDVAGNTSAASSALSFTLDTSAAAPTAALTADTGASGTDKITNNGAITLSGVETGATIEYSSNGSSGWSSTAPTPSAGSNTIYVRQTDLAGNVSAASSALSFTLDTNAAVLTVALTTDTGASGTDKITSNGAIAVSGAEAGATIEYSSNGSTGWSSTTPAVTAGGNTIYARQTDLAGNVSVASSALSFTFDTSATAPTVALMTDSTDGVAGHNTDKISNVGTLAVTGAETGAVLSYSLDSTNGINGTWTPSFSAADGANTVYVRQTDIAGNVSTGTPLTFTYDHAAATPSVALTTDSTDGVAGHNTDRISNVGTLAVTGTEAGAVLSYSTNSTNGIDGSWTSSFTAADGANTVYVRQTDIAGNVSTGTALSFTYDHSAAAPTVALTADTGASGSDKITSNGAITLSGAEVGATIEYSSNGTSGWSATAPTATEGSNTVYVRQIDVAGNTSAASSALSFTLDSTAPVVQSLSAHSATKTIDLTYDSNLDATHLPATSAFGVTTGGAANAVASMTVSGNVLTLTLTDAFAAGAVDVSYVDPTAANDAGAVQDVSGNDATSFIQGMVADGYVRGAQIYIDSNGNGVADASEKLVGVVTDGSGNFFMPSTAPHGTIIAVGGVNIDTGVPNTVALKAPEGSTTVNPLTTLVQAVIDAAPSGGAPITAAQASSSVAQALGLTLPSGESLTSYDPLSATDSHALGIQKAAAQVATTLALAAAAPAGTSTATQAVDAVIGNLVSEINGAITASTTLNLASASTVDALFSNGSGGSVASSAAVLDAKSALVDIAAAASLDGVTIAQSTVLDNVAPATPGIDLIASSDSGVSNTDNLTNDTTPSLRVALEVAKADGTAVVAGDTVAIKDGASSVGTAVVQATDLAQGYIDVTASQLANGAYNLTSTITDKGGNSSVASANLALTIDVTATAPTVALTADTGASGTDKITSNGAVTVSGAETGATIEYSGNGTTGWSSTVPTPSVGSNTVYVRQTDLAGNTSVASGPLSFTLDSTAPTASIVLADSALKAGETSGVSITFSEAVTSFDNTDLTLANGTLSTLASSDGGKTWTGTFTPTANLESTTNAITLATGYTDIAGNTGTAASSANYAIDTLAPTLAITSSVNAVKAGESAAITFTFSEDPGTSFAAGDVTTSGGTLGTISGAGLTRSATFTPTSGVASGNASITVASASYTDAAGNSGGAGSTPAISIDTLAPTVTPTAPVDGGLSLGLASNLTLGANETVVKGGGTVSLYTGADVLVESINVSSGQITITGTGASCQININPTADLVKDQAYYVKASAGAFTDVAGNVWVGIADATTWNFTGAGATVLVNPVAIDNTVNLLESAQTITVTGTLGAETAILAAYKVTDMTAVLHPASGADVTLTNFVYSYSSGATGTWSADIAPAVLSGTSDYTLTVSFVGTSGAAANIVGAGTNVVHVDTVVAAPTVALTTDSTDGVAGHNTDRISNVGTLVVTGTETNAVLSYSANSTNGIDGTWTPSFTAADGANTVYVRQTDVAGNTSAASNALAFTLDTTAPAVSGVAFASATGLLNNTLNANDVLSVVVAMNDATTVTTSGGTPTLGLIVGGTQVQASYVSGSGTSALVFNYTIQPGQTDGNGVSVAANSLALNGGALTDIAGNAASLGHALVADNSGYLVDTNAPTVSVADPTNINLTTGAVTFDFSFSEAVTGFDASDVTVGNGTKGAFTATDSSHYSLVITPTSSPTPLDLTLDVVAGAATDAAGNASVAGAHFIASVLAGTSGSDILQPGSALDHIFMGGGNDVIKFTHLTDSTTTATDKVLDVFGAGDKIDLSALLGTGGSGYTASALGDSGVGFAEIKNVSLTKLASSTVVSFDVTLDSASYQGNKISAATIDLAYNYASVDGNGSVVTSATYSYVNALNKTVTADAWPIVVPNLGGVSANGMIAMTAFSTPANTNLWQNGSNPIIDSTGKAISVDLLINSVVSTFQVGFDKVDLSTMDGQGVTRSYSADVGITKTAGVSIGTTGMLEIITDTSTLGTVGDNQLHMVSSYDATSNTTHLQVQYDTNASFGSTNLSSIIALDFNGDVTASLTPANLTYI